VALLLAAQARLRQAGLWLACAFLFVIMLLGGADAISSFVFNTPVPAMLEISETLLAAAVFLALASAAGQHVVVDVVVQRLSAAAKKLCTALALVVAAVVFGLIAWRFWELALDSIRVNEIAAALVAFPIWPAKVLAAIGATLAAIESLLTLIVLPARQGTEKR
jgi:TRAP-type C4-dicarboxylate transport system permease small subunit